MKFTCELRKSNDLGAECAVNTATSDAPTGGSHWVLSCRFQLAFIGFLGTLTTYLQLASMSIAIVCMTYDPVGNVTSLPGAGQNESIAQMTETTTAMMTNAEAGAPCGAAAASSDMTRRFPLSRDMRGLVLSSFYIGYILTQLPSGWAARRWGAKWTLLVGMSVLTVLTLFTPLVAQFDVRALMAVQAVKGAASGAFFPVFYHMLGNWALPTERSMMVAMFSSGAPIGTVVSFVLSGYLCENGFAGGWPSIFYTFGIVSAVWCFFWVIIAHDTPNEHPRITDGEKDLFQSSLKFSDSDSRTKERLPWRQILTTWPLYAIFFTDMCYSFGWFVALTSLPQYLKDVHKFDIQQNGFYNSLPYISNWAVSIFGSIVADFILRKKVISVTIARKLFETFGLVPSAACAIGVAFLSTSVPRLYVVALLSLWVGFLGFTRSGADVNLIELAPPYAGFIMGIDQTLSSVCGIVAPPIVSQLTQQGLPGQWRTVFLLTAVVSLVGWLLFTLCSTAEQATWCRDQNAAMTCAESPPHQDRGQQRATEPGVVSVSPLEVVTVSSSALEVATPGGGVLIDAASRLPPGKDVTNWRKM